MEGIYRLYFSIYKKEMIQTFLFYGIFIFMPIIQLNFSFRIYTFYVVIFTLVKIIKECTDKKMHYHILTFPLSIRDYIKSLFVMGVAIITIYSVVGNVFLAVHNSIFGSNKVQYVLLNFFTEWSGLLFLLAFIIPIFLNHSVIKLRPFFISLIIFIGLCFCSILFQIILKYNYVTYFILIISFLSIYISYKYTEKLLSHQNDYKNGETGWYY